MTLLFTKGGTSPRVQASVLDLYDMYRLTAPCSQMMAIDFRKIPTFEQLDTQIANALAGLGGAPVVLINKHNCISIHKTDHFEFLGKISWKPSCTI